MFIWVDGGGARRPPPLRQGQRRHLHHYLRRVGRHHRRRCHCRRCRRHCCCSPPPPPHPLLPPLQHVTLGEGARERAYNLNRIGRWGGSISSGNGKKVKKDGIVRRVMLDFCVKINPSHKSGDAVACASVAPVRLHCLIRHKGINTYESLQRGGGMGGGGLITLMAFGRSSPTSPILGIIFRSAGRHPKK